MAEKITENLETLKINVLSQEQYNKALAAGEVNEKELYFTPIKKDPDAGGGGGGSIDPSKFAPANAIVDKSVYMDSVVGITWEKRIDGTCTYGNMFEAELDIEWAREGNLLFTTELDFGFDIYDLAFATYCHESAYEDYLEVRLIPYEDLPNCVGIEVYPKEGLVELMEDRGEDWIPVMFDIAITGRWWEE